MQLALLSRTYRSEIRKSVRRAGLALALLALTACGGRPTPLVTTQPGDSPRQVLVFVPGITGSVLRDTGSGQVAWGVGRNLIRPRDGGHGLAIPIGGGSGGRTLQAAGILRSIQLFGLRKQVYQPIVDLFEANGYRLGDLESPEPDDNLFLFAYDWRQDNVASAQQLFRALEHVRRARGDQRLAIDLVCQSNGGYVCRWLSRYGGASLESTEAGEAAPPATIDVHQVVLVGTANCGSLRTLREMTRGRRYVPWLGKRFEPETFFTITAFFQDLPTYRDDLFVDPDGHDMTVDLFDPASWERYGWSIFGQQAARSLAHRRADPAFFGDLAARRAHLAQALGRSRRLHDALNDDAPIAATTRFHLIQNIVWPTPDRGVLAPRSNGGFDLWFTGDKQLRKRPTLNAVITADGDGHAPLASQQHLAPSERRALVGEIFPVEAEHFETILQPIAHRRILEILAER